MLPVLDIFNARYGLDKLVIVADYIAELQDKGYEFILEVRIKSEAQSIKHQILELTLINNQSSVIDKADATRLIINYSDKRARQDNASGKRPAKAGKTDQILIF